MEQTVQILSKADSARFDALISKLYDAPRTDARTLLVEHLETAHAYLHGGMPAECTVNLALARQAAIDLSDTALRAECKDLIEELLERIAAPPGPWRGHDEPPLRHAAEPHSERSATALELAGYFHGSGERLGTFYPTKHVVAVMPSFDSASAGRHRLCSAAFPENRVLAASGQQFGQFLEDMRISRSIRGIIMTEVSRILDTGALLVDEYVDWARLECGFLVAFSPTEEIALQVASLLADLQPLSEHWFTSKSIHRLV